MSKRLMAVVGALAGVVVGATPGLARVLEDWPYAKLMKQSDLAVIARAVKTEPADDKPPKHDWPHELVGQNTTFEVVHVFKGRADKRRIRVLHFKWGGLKPGVDPDNLADRVIINGPLLVAFRTRHAPEHLLFLKQLGDDRYEPVSGRIDPALSVRRLAEPEDRRDADE